LRAVRFGLRDPLMPDESAHVAAQMPMPMRGIYRAGDRLAGKPDRIHSRDEFLQKIIGSQAGMAPRRQ
jgi:uncharacterized protein (DUF2267 family)